MQSYSSAPRPPPPPLPSTIFLSFSVFLCVAGRACWQESGGMGEGEEPNPKSYDREKALPFKNHSMLSGLSQFFPVD